jgi:hypothetical protein
MFQYPWYGRVYIPRPAHDFPLPVKLVISEITWLFRSEARSSTRCDPTWPAPPVTRIIFLVIKPSSNVHSVIMHQMEKNGKNSPSLVYGQFLDGFLAFFC